jgi:hypothetical protein
MMSEYTTIKESDWSRDGSYRRLIGGGDGSLLGDVFMVTPPSGFRGFPSAPEPGWTEVAVPRRAPAGAAPPE